MKQKAILLGLALLLVFASHLRLRCDAELDGRRLGLACSPLALDRAETAARACAEEILPGAAELPACRRHYALSLKRPAQTAPALCDALLQGTEGVAVQNAVYVGETCVGLVSDRAEFSRRLGAYIENTLPAWARGGILSKPLRVVTRYGREAYVSTPGDMVLLVTGAAPVFFYDGEGNFATA